MKVGLYEVFVWIPLLFAVIRDLVSIEERSGLSSQLLYADDLVLIAPLVEELCRRGAECQRTEGECNQFEGNGWYQGWEMIAHIKY